MARGTRGDGGRWTEGPPAREGASGGGEQNQQRNKQGAQNRIIIIYPHQSCHPASDGSTQKKQSSSSATSRENSVSSPQTTSARMLDDDESTGDAIYGFDELVATTTKMFKIAKVRSPTATVTGSIDRLSPSDRYSMSVSSCLSNTPKVCPSKESRSQA